MILDALARNSPPPVRLLPEQEADLGELQIRQGETPPPLKSLEIQAEGAEFAKRLDTIARLVQTNEYEIMRPVIHKRNQEMTRVKFGDSDRGSTLIPLVAMTMSQLFV